MSVYLPLHLMMFRPSDTAVIMFQERACGLQVTPPSPTATVTVIGDTHGQLHDVIGPL